MEVPTLHTANLNSMHTGASCSRGDYVYKRANFDELNESMLHSSEEFFAFNPGNFFVEEN